MKVLIAGDFYPQNRVKEIVEKGFYEDLFVGVKEVIKQGDYSIVNFERPVVINVASPIEKAGPNLKSSEKAVEAIKWVGFQCVTLSNNHFLDYGTTGVVDTISTLDANGIDHVGGGMNFSEASRTFYKIINGQRLAIINCCEHEFSIATDSTAGSNPLNPIQQFYSIQEARNKADYVLVIVHGGHEHFQLPSPRMVETYRFFVDAGADAVINHHQHCFSGYEEYKGKPIFYGIGNFLFDTKPVLDNSWNYGYMVMLDMSQDNTSFEIYPYSQCLEKPRVELLAQNVFDKQLEKLNNIIANPDMLKREIDSYYKSCSIQYSNIFEPIYSRFFFSAKRRGWLPSLIGRKRVIGASNYICCESHRDKLEWWLSHQ